MKAIIVDASVAIKWFIPEVHAELSTHVLNENFVLYAPDLIFAEIGNILWKKCRSKEVAFSTASAILSDFKRVPINVCVNDMLINEAWRIAYDYQCTVYDSLYVAMAKMKQGILVTADKSLFQNINTSTLSKHILWIEDIASILPH